MGAVGSWNGFVKTGLGVLWGRRSSACSGICDYLLLVPPRHPPPSSAINTFLLLVFTASRLDKSRYLYTCSKLRSLSVQRLLVPFKPVKKEGLAFSSL